MRSSLAAAAVVAALSLGACAQAVAPMCAAPLKSALQIELYFGRDKPTGGEVSEADWAQFLTEIVTPRFPDGFSVVNVEGQTRELSGRIVRERTKRLAVVVFDAPAHRAKIDQIVETYRQRFSQYGVFRIEQPVCAGV